MEDDQVYIKNPNRAERALNQLNAEFRNCFPYSQRDWQEYSIKVQRLKKLINKYR